MREMFAWQSETPWFICEFSEKSDGPMPRVCSGQSSEGHLVDRDVFFRRCGLDPSRIVMPELVHGSRVEIVDASHDGMIIPQADALITQTGNVVLTVTGADCFPIWFADPVRRVIGLAHAGWRGVVGGIVQSILRTMGSVFATDPADVRVGIGPGIRSCHFSFSEAHRYFGSHPAAVDGRAGGTFVDISFVIREDLVSAGVGEDHIADQGVCTFCGRGRYFSHRRDQTDPMELQVACAAIKETPAFEAGGGPVKGEM